VLGLLSVAATTATLAAASRPAQDDTPPRQEFTITVTERGFDPSSLTVKKGVPTRLTFVRTDDKTCATEVVIPALKVRKALPLNAKVSLQFTPADAGDIGFACGHQMFTGTVVVQ
jgi:plastocyanin domain-containing protein